MSSSGDTVSLRHTFDGAVEVECQGVLDVLSMVALRSALVPPGFPHPGDVVLDLTAVEHLDVAAATVVAAAALAARRRGTGFSVRLPQGSARRCLDQCGLTGMLTT